MRPKTAQNPKAKKSVGFSLTGTKIEPPDDFEYPKGHVNKHANLKTTHNVSKAKEFESFKQIPRYSHVPMAVINPSPVKVRREVWNPPSNLTFDG